MTNTKMTIAEKLEAMKAMVATDVKFADGSTVLEFLEDRIEKAQRKSSTGVKGKQSVRSKESAERREKIYEAVVTFVKEKNVDLVAGFQIVEATSFTSGQVSSALVALAKEGRLKGYDNAVTTDRGHKVKGYEVVGE